MPPLSTRWSLVIPFILGRILMAGTVHAAGSPNIVVIYADDLGYGDVQCYNPDRGKISTPHIDRLAAEGIRLTQAFTATAMCAPTRSQLYTGIYPVRSGAFPNHSQVRSGTKSIVHYLTQQ